MLFKNTGRGVPILTDFGIDDIVDLHYVAGREQIARKPADVRRLNVDTLPKLPAISKVPTVVDWRNEVRVERAFDSSLEVLWLGLRERKISRRAD